MKCRIPDPVSEQLRNPSRHPCSSGHSMGRSQGTGTEVICDGAPASRLLGGIPQLMRSQLPSVRGRRPGSRGSPWPLWRLNTPSWCGLTLLDSPNLFPKAHGLDRAQSRHAPFYYEHSASISGRPQTPAPKRLAWPRPRPTPGPAPTCPGVFPRWRKLFCGLEPAKVPQRFLPPCGHSAPLHVLRASFGGKVLCLLPPGGHSAPCILLGLCGTVFKFLEAPPAALLLSRACHFGPIDCPVALGPGETPSSLDQGFLLTWS